MSYIDSVTPWTWSYNHEVFSLKVSESHSPAKSHLPYLVLFLPNPLLGSFVSVIGCPFSISPLTEWDVELKAPPYLETSQTTYF